MFVVAAILLAIFVLPNPWGWAVIALAVLFEIVETSFWIRVLGRVPVRSGPEALIGRSARVVRACRPVGEVRVQGEVWRARCEVGADEGDRVLVRSRDGLTLVVEPA